MKPLVVWSVWAMMNGKKGSGLGFGGCYAVCVEMPHFAVGSFDGPSSGGTHKVAAVKMPAPFLASDRNAGGGKQSEVIHGC